MTITNTGWALIAVLVLLAIGGTAAGVDWYKNHKKPMPVPKPTPAPVPGPVPTPARVSAGGITGPVIVSAAYGGSLGPNQAPQAYYPYSTGQASAYDSSYANELKGDAAVPTQPLTDVNTLLPASWRPGSNMTAMASAGSCASTDAAPAVPGSNWTKFAPTRAAFEQSVIAGASMRTSMNDRSPLTKNVGLSDFYQMSRRIAPPLEAAEVTFNDSSFRQDLIHQQTGRYPTSTVC